MNIMERLDNEAIDIQKRLARVLEIKRLAQLLPLEIQKSKGHISVYSSGKLYVNLAGGDLKYAELFDLGFEFPPKPTFNEYNQEFSRETKMEVLDKTQVTGDEESGYQPTKVQVEITIEGIEKPPSCRVVSYDKLEVVKKFKAVCDEDGSEL